MSEMGSEESCALFTKRLIIMIKTTATQQLICHHEGFKADVMDKGGREQLKEICRLVCEMHPDAFSKAL